MEEGSPDIGTAVDGAAKKSKSFFWVGYLLGLVSMFVGVYSQYFIQGLGFGWDLFFVYGFCFW